MPLTGLLAISNGSGVKPRKPQSMSAERTREGVGYTLINRSTIIRSGRLTVADGTGAHRMYTRHHLWVTPLLWSSTWDGDSEVESVFGHEGVDPRLC